ncbi:MAG: DUF5103 domain-containing protein [Bacteroidia bacterium]|nr:DUF5103 domain-containing protein [Bacteroidia bacterium]
MNKYLSLFFFFLLFAGTLYSQDEPVPEYFDNNYLRYTDHIYKNNIKTAEIYREGWELSYPYIELNSADKIKLSFDDLDGGTKNYWYKLIHCDADWEPSDINYSDCIDGFEFNQINDNKFSFNTLCQYTHYNLSIPNDDVKLKISGNYIIEVLEDFDETKIVLTRKFYVVEYRMVVDAEVKRASLIDLKKTHQEVDFTINKDASVSDPYGEIKVFLLQNNRWDNAISGLKPVFIKDNQLIYNYNEENTFAGGCEFRYFNCNSVRFQSERVKGIVYEPPYYHFNLLPDPKLTFNVYSYHEDINGKFQVDVENGDDKEREADYVNVTFTLPYDAPVVKGNIYVSGSFTFWNFDTLNQMKYDYVEKAYKLTLFLKQGYYNYQYLYVKDGTTTGDVSLTEGSHYETENDYIILVYFHDVSIRYDKLTGLKIVNSLKKL